MSQVVNEVNGINSLIPSRFLPEEEEKKFWKSIFNDHQSISFIDWKIMPSFKVGLDDGQNAFKWHFDFKAVVGQEGLAKEDSASFNIDLHEKLREMSKKIGLNMVRLFQDAGPTPWKGTCFSISVNSSIDSWKNLNETFILSPWISSYSYELPSYSSRKIVGVLQVKDAESIIEQTINNILPLVDYLLIIENNSRDSTLEKIEKIAEINSKVLIKNTLNTESGGRYLYSLCATDTVVVKVDADEVWNPDFSLKLRETLVDLDFDSAYKMKILDGFLNVNKIDLESKRVSGKLVTFPSIYFFGNIMAWPQQPERLHGEPLITRNKIKKEVEVQVPSPPILHFPFLNLSKNEWSNKKTFKPGWMRQKQAYVAGPDNLSVHSLENFNVVECLEKILEGKSNFSVNDFVQK